jgi:Uncharacterized protein conserved in bacteria (DUF2252)
MRDMRSIRACGLYGCLALALCVAVAGPTAHTPASAEDFGAPASLRLDRDALLAQGAPASLLRRVQDNVFVYFRLLAAPFVERACHEFRDLRWRLPYVAVHGDAHVEQFAVLRRAYGLADFDQAGFGPSVVDLVRYSASLHLACRLSKWPCNADSAVTAYLQAYRAALDRPVERSAPAVVRRLRQDSLSNIGAWLAAMERSMTPLPRREEAALRIGWQQFEQLMRETAPVRAHGFYSLVSAGYTDLGVGSALESKILIRMAGPTRAPDDDIIAEARAVSGAASTSCVSRPKSGAALHTFLLGTLFHMPLPDVFGFLPFGETPVSRELWVQSYDPGYKDLTISDLQSQDDLESLARDAGTQLAGHFWTAFPEPLRAHQRFAQLRAFDLTIARAQRLARTLATETETEWQRFRQVP